MSPLPPAAPLILVTNDDGVLAHGIQILSEALRALGDVVIVAPATEQSGVSHGISVTKPLQIRRMAADQYTVNGTPADTVICGVLEICPRKPDLVVSGVNHGCNLASDVFYSGTVAAAREGALRGISSIAVSQALPVLPDEEDRPRKFSEIPDAADALKAAIRRAATFTAAVARQVLTHPLPQGTLLNVNAPRNPTERYAWTTLAPVIQRDQLIRRTDPRGIPYYWLGSSPDDAQGGAGTDCWAVREGIFSITPIGTHPPVDLEMRPPWTLSEFVTA